MSWSAIGAAFIKKGTHLATEEIHQAGDKAKIFALILVGVSIGFLIFYVGALLKLSELAQIPPSSVLLGGGFFLMMVTLVLGRRKMRKVEPGDESGKK